jgi:hypothetical protein
MIYNFDYLQSPDGQVWRIKIGLDSVSDLTELTTERATLQTTLRDITGVAVVTTNINITQTAPPILDGVTLQQADLILLTNQTDPTQNGIWQFANTVTPLSRHVPYDAIGKQVVFRFTKTSNGQVWWYVWDSDLYPSKPVQSLLQAKIASIDETSVINWIITVDSDGSLVVTQDPNAAPASPVWLANRTGSTSSIVLVDRNGSIVTRIVSTAGQFYDWSTFDSLSRATISGITTLYRSIYKLRIRWNNQNWWIAWSAFKSAYLILDLNSTIPAPIYLDSPMGARQLIWTASGLSHIEAPDRAESLPFIMIPHITTINGSEREADPVQLSLDTTGFKYVRTVLNEAELVSPVLADGTVAYHIQIDTEGSIVLGNPEVSKRSNSIYLKWQDDQVRSQILGGQTVILDPLVKLFQLDVEAGSIRITELPKNPLDLTQEWNISELTWIPFRLGVGQGSVSITKSEQLILDTASNSWIQGWTLRTESEPSDAPAIHTSASVWPTVLWNDIQLRTLNYTGTQLILETPAMLMSMSDSVLLKIAFPDRQIAWIDSGVYMDREFNRWQESLDVASHLNGLQVTLVTGDPIPAASLLKINGTNTVWTATPTGFQFIVPASQYASTPVEIRLERPNASGLIANETDLLAVPMYTGLRSDAEFGLETQDTRQIIAFLLKQLGITLPEVPTMESVSEALNAVKQYMQEQFRVNESDRVAPQLIRLKNPGFQLKALFGFRWSDLSENSNSGYFSRLRWSDMFQRWVGTSQWEITHDGSGWRWTSDSIPVQSGIGVVVFLPYAGDYSVSVHLTSRTYETQTLRLPKWIHVKSLETDIIAFGIKKPLRPKWSDLFGKSIKQYPLLTWQTRLSDSRTRFNDWKLAYHQTGFGKESGQNPFYGLDSEIPKVTVSKVDPSGKWIEIDSAIDRNRDLPLVIDRWLDTETVSNIKPVWTFDSDETRSALDSRWKSNVPKLAPVNPDTSRETVVAMESFPLQGPRWEQSGRWKLGSSPESLLLQKPVAVQSYFTWRELRPDGFHSNWSSPVKVSEYSGTPTFLTDSVHSNANRIRFNCVPNPEVSHYSDTYQCEFAWDPGFALPITVVPINPGVSVRSINFAGNRIWYRFRAIGPEGQRIGDTRKLVCEFPWSSMSAYQTQQDYINAPIQTGVEWDSAWVRFDMSQPVWNIGVSHVELQIELASSSETLIKETIEATVSQTDPNRVSIANPYNIWKWLNRFASVRLKWRLMTESGQVSDWKDSDVILNRSDSVSDTPLRISETEWRITCDWTPVSDAWMMVWNETDGLVLDAIPVSYQWLSKGIDTQSFHRKWSTIASRVKIEMISYIDSELCISNPLVLELPSDTQFRINPQISIIQSGHLTTQLECERGEFDHFRIEMRPPGSGIASTIVTPIRNGLPLYLPHSEAGILWFTMESETIRSNTSSPNLIQIESLSWGSAITWQPTLLTEWKDWGWQITGPNPPPAPVYTQWIQHPTDSNWTWIKTHTPNSNQLATGSDLPAGEVLWMQWKPQDTTQTGLYNWSPPIKWITPVTQGIPFDSQIQITMDGRVLKPLMNSGTEFEWRMASDPNWDRPLVNRVSNDLDPVGSTQICITDSRLVVKESQHVWADTLNILDTRSDLSKIVNGLTWIDESGSALWSTRVQSGVTRNTPLVDALIIRDTESDPQAVITTPSGSLYAIPSRAVDAWDSFDLVLQYSRYAMRATVKWNDGATRAEILTYTGYTEILDPVIKDNFGDSWTVGVNRNGEFVWTATDSPASGESVVMDTLTGNRQFRLESYKESGIYLEIGPYASNIQGLEYAVHPETRFYPTKQDSRGVYIEIAGQRIDASNGWIRLGDAVGNQGRSINIVERQAWRWIDAGPASEPPTVWTVRPGKYIALTGTPDPITYRITVDSAGNVQWETRPTNVSVPMELHIKDTLGTSVSVYSTQLETRIAKPVSHSDGVLLKARDSDAVFGLYWDPNAAAVIALPVESNPAMPINEYWEQNRYQTPVLWGIAIDANESRLITHRIPDSLINWSAITVKDWINVVDDSATSAWKLTVTDAGTFRSTPQSTNITKETPEWIVSDGQDNWKAAIDLKGQIQWTKTAEPASGIWITDALSVSKYWIPRYDTGELVWDSINSQIDSWYKLNGNRIRIWNQSVFGSIVNGATVLQKTSDSINRLYATGVEINTSDPIPWAEFSVPMSQQPVLEETQSLQFFTRPIIFNFNTQIPVKPVQGKLVTQSGAVPDLVYKSGNTTASVLNGLTTSDSVWITTRTRGKSNLWQFPIEWRQGVPVWSRLGSIDAFVNWIKLRNRERFFIREESGSGYWIAEPLTNWTPGAHAFGTSIAGWRLIKDSTIGWDPAFSLFAVGNVLTVASAGVLNAGYSVQTWEVIIKSVSGQLQFGFNTADLQLSESDRLQQCLVRIPETGETRKIVVNVSNPVSPQMIAYTQSPEPDPVECATWIQTQESDATHWINRLDTNAVESKTQIDALVNLNVRNRIYIDQIKTIETVEGRTRITLGDKHHDAIKWTCYAGDTVWLPEWNIEHAKLQSDFSRLQNRQLNGIKWKNLFRFNSKVLNFAPQLRDQIQLSNWDQSAWIKMGEVQYPLSTLQGSDLAQLKRVIQSPALAMRLWKAEFPDAQLDSKGIATAAMYLRAFDWVIHPESEATGWKPVLVGTLLAPSASHRFMQVVSPWPHIAAVNCLQMTPIKRGIQSGRINWLSEKITGEIHVKTSDNRLIGSVTFNRDTVETANEKLKKFGALAKDFVIQTDNQGARFHVKPVQWMESNRKGFKFDAESGRGTINQLEYGMYLTHWTGSRFWIKDTDPELVLPELRLWTDTIEWRIQNGILIGSITDWDITKKRDARVFEIQAGGQIGIQTVMGQIDYRNSDSDWNDPFRNTVSTVSNSYISKSQMWVEPFSPMEFGLERDLEWPIKQVWSIYRDGKIVGKSTLKRLQWLFTIQGTYSIQCSIINTNGETTTVNKENFIVVKNK